MSQSIGQKLAAARKRRDLTIEDVAHETRIHVETLRHLEADDYSRFANVTYARSFLSMYGRHLGLDMADYLRELRSADNGGADSAKSLNVSQHGSVRADPFLSGTDFQRYRPLVALVLVFAMLCAIPGMYFLGRQHGIEAANRIASVGAREAAAQSQDDTPPPADALHSSASPSVPGTVAESPSRPPELPLPQSPADSPARPPITPLIPPTAPIGETTAPAKAEEPSPLQPSGPVEVRRPAVLTPE